MTWTAPDVVRVDEPFVADERSMLTGFLDYNRATLLRKCAGLTGAQMATRSTPPSNLSLLGLVRHVTDVERTWFRYRFGGLDVAPLYAGAFDDLDPAQAPEALDALAAEQVAAREAVAHLPLDHIWVSPRWGPMSLRWALQHMISEYCRHNGHADLLREGIDGQTGD